MSPASLHRRRSPSLQTGKSNDEQILDVLNRFGQEGWRLNRIYGEASLRSLASWRGGLNFLPEREIETT